MRHFGNLKQCLFLLLLIIFSCETEPEPENNPADTGGNGEVVTGDEPAELLALAGADKISGGLPPAPDLLLKMNFKDTIYVLKNGEFGARVVIRHDGLHDISGLYIAVDNSTFYYDVPVIEEAAQDSSDVIYINTEISDEIEANYPLTIPIKIQPHGPGGEPLDEFVRLVTIEDPDENNKCPITIPLTTDTTDLDGGFFWLFTVGVDQSGNIFHEEAPGLKKISRYKTGGCCNDNGSSTTVSDDPHCFQKFSDGTLNPRWRTIEVEHYFEWKYDILWFYDNGTFAQDNLSFQTSYRPSKSDFCKGESGYDFDKGFFHKTGKHDFTPGVDYLKVTYDVMNPPVYGKTFPGGRLAYSCHAMQINFEVEGQRWVMAFVKDASFLGSDNNPAKAKGWD